MLPPYKRTQLAYHETGHIVVAIVEGFGIEGLRINRKGGGEAEIIIACAGRSAEEYAISRMRIAAAEVDTVVVDGEPDGRMDLSFAEAFRRMDEMLLDAARRTASDLLARSLGDPEMR